MDEAGLDLDAVLSAAWQSRKWAEPLLHAWGLREEAPDVLFVLNELVANAVRHTHTPPSVRLHHEPHRLRIEVEDHAMYAEPDEVDAPPTALAGRGLLIVRELSGQWGSELVPGGKVVWAEIPVAA